MNGEKEVFNQLKSVLQTRFENEFEEWAKTKHFNQLLYNAFKSVWVIAAMKGFDIAADIVIQKQKVQS